MLHIFFNVAIRKFRLAYVGHISTEQFYCRARLNPGSASFYCATLGKLLKLSVALFLPVKYSY